MAFNRPIPETRKPSRLIAGVSALAQAEKLMQLALLMPSAAALCWLLGAWADHIFHQSWIGIAGLVFGCLAGFVGVVRMALAFESDFAAGTKNGSQAGKGKGQPKP